MTKKQLEDRVEALEREVAALKAQLMALPVAVHHHYHQPLLQPAVLPSVPVYPYIGDPIPPWTVTCGGSSSQ